MSHEVIICADIIATYKGELVLIQRHTEPIGLALPGGKQNPGELLSETAKREFGEETGLALQIDSVLGTYTTHGRDCRGNYVSTVFIGRAEGNLCHEPGKTTVVLLNQERLTNMSDQLLFDHAQVLSDYRQSAVKGGPISAADAEKYKQASIPYVAFEAFNELIVENLSSGRASVYQADVVDRMVKKGLKKDEIYKKGWLDVEPIYRAAGWKVEYDKPGYNESYQPYFVFSRKS